MDTVARQATGDSQGDVITANNNNNNNGGGISGEVYESIAPELVVQVTEKARKVRVGEAVNLGPSPATTGYPNHEDHLLEHRPPG